MQIRTIDEVIGGNLRRMRTAESLTLTEAAAALEMLSDRSFSTAKLSRWETGHYSFTVTDLYLLSQIYGVSILSLLQPTDDVTHVHANNRDVPHESYAYDFFIDPRGTFTERARELTERRKVGTPGVVDALNDVQERLGNRARIADLLVAAVNTQTLHNAMQSNPQQPAWKTANELGRAGKFHPPDDDTERPDDGVDQQDT